MPTRDCPIAAWPPGPVPRTRRPSPVPTPPAGTPRAPPFFPLPSPQCVGSALRGRRDPSLFYEPPFLHFKEISPFARLTLLPPRSPKPTFRGSHGGTSREGWGNMGVPPPCSSPCKPTVGNRSPRVPQSDGWKITRPATGPNQSKFRTMNKLITSLRSRHPSDNFSREGGVWGVVRRSWPTGIFSDNVPGGYPLYIAFCWILLLAIWKRHTGRLHSVIPLESSCPLFVLAHPHSVD